MASFKFDAHRAFLTYAQSDFDLNGLHQFLDGLAGVLWARLCRETHETGEPHVHAVVQFRRRFQSRSASIFDFEGRHPNIQSVRDVRRSLEYVTKEGNYVDFGAVPTFDKKRTVAELRELAGGPEGDYLQACAESGLQYCYAKRFRELSWRDETTAIGEDYVPDLAWESPLLALHEPQDGLSTVLVGPAGCGKSAWAKRHARKPALFVTHIDTLREFDPTYHKSIIFDDMAFKHLPLQPQIHIVDQFDSRQIHCRYGVAKIPKMTQKFFTCNEEPFVDHDGIRRRIYKIDLF